MFGNYRLPGFDAPRMTATLRRVDLGGTWRAALADDELRRVYADPGFDDTHWEPVAVPGHWRSSSAFADSDGPLLYRTTFETGHSEPGRRSWLELDGLFYQGDVWLDGAYVGDTEGYFFPHHFEVTETVSIRSEHVLAVEVNCSPARDRGAKRNLTGAFQDSAFIDSQWNPGGIWRPVGLTTSGPVRIGRLSTICREADDVRAVVLLHADLLAVDACTVTLRTRLGSTHEHRHEQPLAAGLNGVEWQFAIDQPERWWPWALGQPVVHNIEVAALHSDEISDERTMKIGLRTVSAHQWHFSINGERLFLKGTNLAPSNLDLATCAPEVVERDVQLAKDAGLDLIRLNSHVTRPELYDAADRLGMLVWQDMPLQWGYARSVRKQAIRQARKLVDLLGHHPSIMLWCGHNEPVALEEHRGQEPRQLIRFAAGQQLPTWNKTFLDRSVKRALEKADPSRPVVAHSGVLPHLPQLDGTDSHLWFGWFHGDERDLAGALRVIPRLGRFVSEFGAQAVPSRDDFCDDFHAENWPNLDWELLEQHHGLDFAVLNDRVPIERYATFDAWRQATQAYQAQLVRRHIETLRRLKYRPCGGFAQYMFADAQAAISCSVLDHERVAKLGHQALIEGCRQVIVVADRMPAAVLPNQALALDVHVVSDLRENLLGARVTAQLGWTGGEHTWAWEGSVESDAVTRIATISIIVPEAYGPIRLDLDLVAGDVAAANRYDAAIVS